MKITDYERILDSMRSTGVYVIREDDHRILYFNRRVKEASPDIRLGMVCHDVWAGTCGNCPLLYIDGKDSSRTLNIDSPFGKIVDISADRILWEDEIPAFVISVSSHERNSAQENLRAFEAVLKPEERSIQHQQIIGSLGERNLSIYMVDLATGQPRAIRLAGDVDHGSFVKAADWDQYFAQVLEEKGHPDERGKIWSSFSLEGLRAARDTGKNKVERRVRRMIDGSYHYVLIKAYLHESSLGAYAVIAFQDVDEYTRREMARNLDDKRMSAIIRSRYSFMSVVDLDTGMSDWAYMAEKGVDFHSRTCVFEERIRRVARESIHEEDAKRFLGIFSLESLRKKAEAEKNTGKYVYQFRLKGEPVRWIEAYILFVRQENGTVVSNILGREVTEEKREEEEESQEAQEKASIINSFSSMFISTYFIDLKSDQFRAVTHSEDQEQILGEKRNYTDGLRWYAETYIHPDDRQEFVSCMEPEHLMEKLRPDAPFAAAEYRRIREGGENPEVCAWIRATAILAGTEEGRAKTAVYVEQDMTESKQKENMERRALREACEAAEHANVAKSEFLSRMSHDIRTPLNAIIGMTAIAGTHLDNQERVADCLGKITTASKHLLALINEVLDMSKIESGKIDLAEEEFNMSDLVQSLLTMIRPAVHAKKQELALHIVHIEHEDLVGDVLRLQQVFMNMMGNSVKYTPEGGKLEVEITEKPSRVFGYACFDFVFRDNGIGMSREFLERIFEPFARAEDSRVSKIEGTGLGMTIAQNIVRMMNGSIRVESEIGKGSVFYVTVFLKVQDVKSVDVMELVDLPVLVADDDQIACEAACNVLDDIGMRGEYVLSGEEAVERVAEVQEEGKQFFAVILDWQMPGMDGLETARNIRREVGSDVPIIILSSYDWSEVEAEARLAGVDGFISKPLFKSRLVYLFKRFLHNEDKNDGAVAAQENLDFTGRRVLLAEDNELNREIAEEILSCTGVEVESVPDGQEALNKFLENEEGYYDMIFMDIQMPVMNGYEATGAIRRARRGDAKTIPIIAMTANAFTEDVISSKRAGMNEHVSKPLSVEQLIECMARWIGRHAE